MHSICLHYIDIRDDMATVLHQLFLWSIFLSTGVHITVTGPYYGPLGKIFTFAITLIILVPTCPFSSTMAALLFATDTIYKYCCQNY